ncbi:hypothetical protein FOM02_13095 [Bradyrhizobium sp. SEMIA]|nr:hypothetical protein FOM02_13095 [Bradyrhizobium sp. SEMIA]
MAIGQIANFVRSKGDPKVVSTGPSSFGASDRMARNLGWFSLGLGALEMLAPERVTRALGMQGQERLVRAYGAREIASGVLSLSADKNAGLWSRVAGDGLDIVTLMGGLHADNPKRGNVALALLMVGGITLLDFATAKEVGARHAPGSGSRRNYYDRTGYPKGMAASRGISGPKKLRKQLAAT